MKQANPSLLAAEIRARRADVLISDHAIDRTFERSRIAPSRVREMIATRQAVLLPWCSHERGADRTYHLLYDKEGEQFIVAVVASNAPGDSCSHMVTLLTREQFENDAGLLSKRTRRHAASLVLDPVSFRAWEEKEFAGQVPRRRFRVISYFQQDDQPAEAPMANVVFQNAPVCGAFTDEHSLSNAASHPGFWEWYREQAARSGLPIDRVVAIRIADTYQVKLDIGAAPLECPCCAQRSKGRVH